MFFGVMLIFGEVMIQVLTQFCWNSTEPLFRETFRWYPKMEKQTHLFLYKLHGYGRGPILREGLPPPKIAGYKV